VRDGVLLRSVKAVARGAFFLNLRSDRALRRLRGAPPPFLLGGDCRRCAACCEAPAIRAHAFVFLGPRLRRAFLWWQERVNGFVLVETLRAERTFVFRCTHFDAQTRSCDSYASRPGMCRDYPRALLAQPDPALLTGCGYRPLARGAPGLRQALANQPLTEEQRARLARDLHLH
jgi:Fe-S-cluster containining protein